MNTPCIVSGVPVSRSKAALLAATALVTGLMASQAHAQDTSGTVAAEQAPAEADTAIIVTGTRLASGFNAPTPITVTTSEQLQASAPANVADGLNQLPQFSSLTRTTNPSTAVNNGPGAGQNILNLRSLGGPRTLILLNGKRLPSSNAEGSVDANVIPQALIQRVDVVTGGASAAYGSDAVAGVVNFVLDTKFKGLKGEVSGGISTYGDLPQVQAQLTGGFSGADDRLHVVVAGEYFRQSGLTARDDTGRDWFERPAGLVNNPVSGARPSLLTIRDFRSALGTYGGLITNGPLAGLEFAPGGALVAHDFGTRYGNFQDGGNGPRLNIGFTPKQERAGAFMHTEFEVSDSFTVFAEGAFNYSHTLQGAFNNPHIGTANQFTIFRDNAFLPAAVAALMDARGITSFTMGRIERDFPLVEIESFNRTFRGILGVRGDLSDRWSWDASVQWGRTNLELRQNNVSNNRNLYAAVDAVRNASGTIVCRSTLAGLDAGCVPLNLFGEGSPSAGALSFVLGDSWKKTQLTQTVTQINLRGDLGEAFSFGAGPISIAAGAELRTERVAQTTDPISPTITSTVGLRGAPAAQSNRLGGYNFHNPLPLAGDYSIGEGYVELGVPVLRDLRFAQELNLTAAARYANYSTSGGVTTWKAGANWTINDGIKLRMTRSRDIRAPNVLELFNSATQGNSNVIFNGVTTPVLAITSGNPALQPERANTLTYGLVLRPSFLPGFQFSVDRYDIKLQNVIGSLGQQQAIDECAKGNQVACGLITVTAANTLIMRLQTLNLNFLRNRGFDFEASYQTNLGAGSLQLRLLANHTDLAYLETVGAIRTPTVGTPGLPSWKGAFQLTYKTDKLTVFAQQRYQGPAKIDITRVEGVGIDQNDIPAYFYTDLTLAYKIGFAGGDNEIFATVNNLFNKAPPVAPFLPTNFNRPTQEGYDILGRYFTAGVRFKF